MNTSPTQIIRLKDMDPDEEPGRDIPKRAPLDWLRNPLTEAFARSFVVEDALYLDTIFKRLYNGSSTFRALLALNPEIINVPAMINLLKSNAGALNIGYDEVDINPHRIGLDENGHIGTWVIAHEYRHVFQVRRAASIFDGGGLADVPGISLRSFLALHRAMEGDSNAFAATCFSEVLLTEGIPGYKIGEAMADTGLSGIMQAYAQAARNSDKAITSGHAATRAFDAFFHSSNKNILRSYDAKLMGIFKPFSIVDDKTAKASDGFTSRFNAMKTMPYLTQDHVLVERREYLAEINFETLKKLPHTGFLNRIYQMLLKAPPWSRNL